MTDEQGNHGESPSCETAPIVLPDPPSDGDIAGWLNAIPDVVSVQEQPMDPGAPRFFWLTFDQPVDHCRPDGDRFVQAATFLFRGFEAPTVLASTGYGIGFWPYQTEPTLLFEANQLLLEHRYFGASKPDTVAWSTLDIEQSARDQHRLAVAMRHFLTGPWLSTGASKGGMTAVFHRHFFPDDVEATLAYVAPLSFERSDPRYVDYLQSVGEPECQAALEALQRRAVELRGPLTGMMVEEAQARGDGYDLLGAEQAFSFGVVELGFSFWQYGELADCAFIPGPEAGASEVFAFMQYVFGDLADWYGDAAATYYEAYWHQSATQLGGPAFPQDHLLDLLEGEPIVYEAQLYPPYGVDQPWDPDAMREVDEWVRTEGEQLMFVYGEWDPWTAGAFTVGEGLDARVYVVPEGNHGAILRDLPPALRTEAESLLRDWLGLEVPSGALRWAPEAYEVTETLLPRWPRRGP